MVKRFLLAADNVKMSTEQPPAPSASVSHDSINVSVGGGIGSGNYNGASQNSLASRSKSIELLSSTGMGDLTVTKSYKRETKHRFVAMPFMALLFVCILVQCCFISFK